MDKAGTAVVVLVEPLVAAGSEVGKGTGAGEGSGAGDGAGTASGIGAGAVVDSGAGPGAGTVDFGENMFEKPLAQLCPGVGAGVVTV